MYVCSCNALTDDDVRAVAQDAGHRVADVYKCLGCSAQCGACARSIHNLLKDIQGLTPRPCQKTCMKTCCFAKSFAQPNTLQKLGKVV